MRAATTGKKGRAEGATTGSGDLRSGAIRGRLIAGVLGAMLAGAIPLPASAAEPKFFFQTQGVKATANVDAATKAFTAGALKDELAKRPEWASDVGPAGQAARPGQDRAALVAELKRRNLRGFDVTVRFETFNQELKVPRPGGRLKQVAVDVRLTVFGTTIPDAKLAFSGSGQSGLEAEVADKRIDADIADAARDAVRDALKQAVDQAVLKLSIGKSQPMNEARHRKK